MHLSFNNMIYLVLYTDVHSIKMALTSTKKKNRDIKRKNIDTTFVNVV